MKMVECRICGKEMDMEGLADNVCSGCSVPFGICNLCGEKIKGYGNNSEPLKKGKCCDKCNIEKVVPERMRQNLMSQDAIELNESFGVAE